MLALESNRQIATGLAVAVIEALLFNGTTPLYVVIQFAASVIVQVQFPGARPVAVAPVKKNTVLQVTVPGATNIEVPNPATIPTDPTLTEEIFNKSSPKQIVADFGDDAVKAFANSLSIPFTDNEDAMLIASRVKKYLKTKPDAE